jgi:hypothetical protein
MRKVPSNNGAYCQNNYMYERCTFQPIEVMTWRKHTKVRLLTFKVFILKKESSFLQCSSVTILQLHHTYKYCSLYHTYYQIHVYMLFFMAAKYVHVRN